jgi:transcriptional regulator with XRE-family HTH domain
VSTMDGEGFGWRLRRTREQAQLTQEVLAGRAGISRSWVARIESGGRPGLAEAIALYETLAGELPGLSLEWLLAGRGNRQADDGR